MSNRVGSRGNDVNIWLVRLAAQTPINADVRRCVTLCVPVAVVTAVIVLIHGLVVVSRRISWLCTPRSASMSVFLLNSYVTYIWYLRDRMLIRQDYSVNILLKTVSNRCSCIASSHLYWIAGGFFKLNLHRILKKNPVEKNPNILSYFCVRSLPHVTSTRG